jgi:O-antigen ligase
MATFISESPSAGRRSHAAWALAVRVVRVAGGLLFAGLLLLPVRGFIAADTGLAGSLAVVGLFFVSLVRPEDGLLVCAGLLIVAGPLGAVLGSQARMGEALLLAFLAGWVLRETVRPQKPIDGPARALVMPALLLAAVVASSVLVQLIIEQVFVDYPWPFFRAVLTHFASDYVLGSRLPGLDSGAGTLEGIGLFVATVVLTWRQRALAIRVARMAAVGAVAVAALNLNRFATICLRTATPLQTFAVKVRGIRISSVFADFNAAGSYLAMMLLLAVGFAAGNRRTRVVWVGAALLMLASLWLTGSRAALLGAPVGAIFLLAALLRARMGSSWWKPVAGGTMTLVLVVLLVAWFFPPDAGLRPAMGMVQGRVEMVRVSFRMFASSPVFGVGVGRFWTLSNAYMDTSRTNVSNENAHNNFLQILAELGIVGLVSFLWILVALAKRMWRASGAGEAPVLAGSGAGILAFLVTCLAGHPLLVREVCYAFWLVLGAVAAFVLNERPAASGRINAVARWHRLIPAAIVICLAVSVPLRAHRFLDKEAELDNIGAGFSPWQWDKQGVRFRTMSGRAKFYVPSGTCRIALPLRADGSDGRQVVIVEITLDGRPANRVQTVRDAWRDVPMVMPADSTARFRTIELRTLPAADAVVRVGKPRLSPCSAGRF